MLYGPPGPQDPSEQKKHVFSSKLSNNSLRTDPKHPLWLQWAQNAICSKKITSFGQNYLKILWKRPRTSLLSSQIATWPTLSLLLSKKERGGGKALHFVLSFFILEEPYLTILGQRTWDSKKYKKTCIFWCSKLKNPILYTLSCSDPTKRVRVMISVHKSMSCGYFCA